LVKLGTAAFNVGLGNFSGVKSGIDAIKGAYNAYKSSDDQDFNDFIRQPFLTSKEQVGITALRSISVAIIL
jgi:hypothetical protein